jgi:hypothetical protein
MVSMPSRLDTETTDSIIRLNSVSLTINEHVGLASDTYPLQRLLGFKYCDRRFALHSLHIYIAIIIDSLLLL